MAAIGYIRQSRRADLDLALSRDAQLAAIRRLCDDCPILEDMGRSGKAGAEHLRPGYQRLVAGIESGEYTEVYAIALSRFSRSVPELHTLLDLARVRGVKITTAKEGTLDPHTATGKLMFNIWSSFAEFVRDSAVEAALENAAVRRSRGERMGRVPYGERPGDDPAAIVAAFYAAGQSFAKAARLLNERGVETWLGRLWTARSIRLVVARHVPGIVPGRALRGVKPSSPFLLFRLLRCHCDRTMTASRDGRGNRDVVYRCHAADTDPGHARPYRIREAEVLPWIRNEAALLDVPGDRLQMQERNAAALAALEDQRRAVGDALTVRAYTVDQAAAKVAQIEAAIAELEATERVAEIAQAVDWSWDAQTINTTLRALFHYVELGPDLLPVRAEWTVPEWRRPSGKGLALVPR